MSDTIYADDRDEDTPDLTGLEDGGRDEDDLMAENDKMMDDTLNDLGRPDNE